MGGGSENHHECIKKERRRKNYIYTCRYQMSTSGHGWLTADLTQILTNLNPYVACLTPARAPTVPHLPDTAIIANQLHTMIDTSSTGGQHTTPVRLPRICIHTDGQRTRRSNVLLHGVLI